MKIRKLRRQVSWLLVLMMVLNVFSPLNIVWAGGLGALNDSSDSVIKISNHDNVATGSQAHKPDFSGGEEKTNVPEKPGELNEDQEEPTTATSSNASYPKNKGSLLTELGSNCSDWLNSLLELEITQNGNSIPPGGKIDPSQSFNVKGKFLNIPLTDETEVLNYGDYAIFELDPNLSLSSGSATHDLKFGGKTIGILTFETPPSGTGLQVRIDFNGDLSVWDDYTDIKNLQFSAELDYIDSEIEEGSPEKDIIILGKTYKIYKPVPPIVPFIQKSGSKINGDKEILWTVTVDATKKSIGGQSLNGFIFTDALKKGDSSAGDYVQGSFNIDDALIDDSEVLQSDKTLQYTFTEGDIGPKTITYRTKVPGNVQFGSENVSFRNSANFKKENLEATDDDTVTIQKKNWIKKKGILSEKSGQAWDPEKRTITWYIEVNEPRYELEDITISDVLDNKKLIFESAQWQKNIAQPNEEAVWYDVGTKIGLPNDNKYTFPGKTSDHMQLIIVTKIKTGDYIQDADTISNTASVTWKGKPGDAISAEAPGINVGFNVLNKSGEFDSNWKSNHLVNWTISLNFEKQLSTGSLSKFKIYDLFVHNKNSGAFNLSDCTLKDENDKDIALDTNILKNISPKYGQKYNQLEFDNDLNVKRIKVIKNDDHIADLIEISGFTDDKPYQVKFSSKMLNPEDFIKNGRVIVHNIATLFEGTTLIKNVTADPNTDVNVLTKNILQRVDETAESSLNGDARIGGPDNGFNYTTKTAFFRLKVNESGQNLTDPDFNSNPISVTDKLPAGWEFDHGYNTKGYKIFAGNTPTTELIDSNDPVKNLVFQLDGDRNTAVFTFDSLDKAYIILVKAKLTDEAYADYIKNNATDKTVQNDAILSSDGVTVSSNANVKVNTDVVSKNYSNSQASILRWTIDYNPLTAMIVANHDDVTIKDSLSSGLELRLGTDGKLDITDENLFIEEMDLKSDGTLMEQGSRNNLAVSLWESGKLTYNISTRELEIQVPDGKKAYRVTYLTDLTGAKDATVENNVEVAGVTANKKQSRQSYKIDESDASAMLVLGGYLRIKKIDENGNKVLPGAKFGIFTESGALLREDVTADDGILRFGALREGTYILKETKAPDEYVRSLEEYTVTVMSKSGNPADGKITTIKNGDTSLISFEKGTLTNITFDVKNHAEKDIGSLTISKTVEGNAGDKDKTFTFHVMVKGTGTNNYPSDNGNILFINNEATLLLKHGENITISNLPKDAEYTVTEDEASLDNHIPTYSGENGYIAAKDTRIVTVTNTKNEVSISKRDAASGNELPGATLQLWKDDTKVDEWVSESTPHIIYNLQDGIYKLIEITAPKGYLTAEEILFTVTDGKTTPVVMFDSHKDEIVISKQDITNGKELPGATLQLWKDGTKIDEWVSENKPHIIEYLEDGTYELVEIAAPKGYLTAEKITFIVKDGKPDKQIIMLDKPIEISISKQDITNGKELPGATLQLWKDGKKVSEWISENKPYIVKYLEDGTYELVEITAPKGYLKAEKITFIVKDGKTDKPVIMYDKPVEISISKQDITNGKELPGATLQLWKDGKKVKEWISEDKPHVIEKLEDGTYELVEISAPRGYLKAEKIIFTVKDGKTDSPIIMKDKPYTPSTGGSGGGGGGPKPPKPTTPTTPIEPNTPEPAPKPKDELTPQEHYDVYGEVPRGYIIGPDNKVHTPQELYDIWGQVPLGYMVGTDGQLVPLGLPKTGDDLNGSIVIYGLLSITALLGMAVSVSILRRRHTG